MAISIKESFSVGLIDIWSRKLRTFVTIFGIILGTMSIIIVQSLVKGMQEQSMSWLNERGGISKITVDRNRTYEKDDSSTLKSYFTYKEFNQIRSLLPNIGYFSAQIFNFGSVSYNQNQYWGRVIGVLPEYTKIEEWEPAEGRFFSEYDLTSANDVIVIGSDVKKELFGNKNALNEFVTFKKRRYRVIGVMKERYFVFQGNIENENALEYLNQQCFLPLSTMNKKLGEIDIRRFELKIFDTNKIDAVRNTLNGIILNMRQGEPIFSVETAKDRIESMEENTKMFQIIFYFIGGISLLVGGIVIMNLMLATIQERTREIGIRISVGARRRDVFIQFLVQTVIMTGLGGLLGIIIGFGSLNSISRFLNAPMSSDFSMIFSAIIISLLVGLFFGIFPAYRASNLDPVKALQYE